MPAVFDPAVLAAPKRSAPPSGGPAGKRARIEVLQNAWPDVLFGPVTISNSNKAALSALTTRAINYLVQVAANSGQHCVIGEEDISSTQVYRSSPNTLSIRFKLRDKAVLFCALVERYSPLPGQAAIFRGESGGQHGRPGGPTPTAGVANQQTLNDLFGGSSITASER
jgi:hypothetical protein